MHLTVNAEFDLYRWGPITHAPSLLDGDGGFPRTVGGRVGPRRSRRGAPRVPGPDRAGHLVGLRREPPRRPHGHACRSVRSSSTSTSSWPSSSGCRCGSRAPDTEGLIGFPFRSLAAEEGVVFPDDFVHVPGVGEPPDPARRRRRTSTPGVTEASLHPAVDSPELEAMAPDWEARVDDHRLLVHDRELPSRAGRRRRDPDRLPTAARPHAGRLLTLTRRARPAPCRRRRAPAIRTR